MMLSNSLHRLLISVMVLTSCCLSIATRANPNENLIGFENAKQAFMSGDIDDAAKQIKQTLKDQPDNAEAHKLAGAIYSAKAQSASIISAPGLARKALKAFKRGVSLAPDDTQARFNLMQFYLFAPGIVGGDKELGAEQARKIQKLDPIKGVVAHSLLHRANKDKEAHGKLFEELDEELAKQPQIKLAYSSYLANNEQTDAALNVLETLSALTPDSLSGDDKLVPFKAMASIGFLGLQTDNHLEQGIKYLEQYLVTAPEIQGLMPKRWIQYLLAKSHNQAGNQELGKKMLLELQTQTKDKNLKKEIKSTLKEWK